MKVALIMVNYNDYDNVKLMIDNIVNYSLLDEIVIVDNASKDDSLTKLKQIKNKKITILENTANKGYGSGINVGAKYLNNKYGECYIFVSNTDIIINKEQDLKRLIDGMNSDIGICAPVINTHGTLSRGWKVPSPIQDVILNIPYFHRLYEKHLQYKESFYQDKKEVIVEAVSGCFFLINSSLLKKINYFDENMFLYYEENYLANRLKEMDKKEKVELEVEVIHNHSVTIDSNISKINKYKILKKSQYYFQSKYNDASLLAKGLLKLSSRVGLWILTIYYKLKNS